MWQLFIQKSNCWNGAWNDLFCFLNPFLWIHVLFVQLQGKFCVEFPEMCLLCRKIALQVPLWRQNPPGFVPKALCRAPQVTPLCSATLTQEEPEERDWDILRQNSGNSFPSAKKNGVFAVWACHIWARPQPHSCLPSLKPPWLSVCFCDDKSMFALEAVHAKMKP